MERKYSDIGTFLDDMHETLSLKEMVADLGVYTHEELNSTLVPCCFHEDDTPSLQITDKFFRCYAGSCGCKGDHLSFIQNHFNVGFMEAVHKIAEMYHVDISGIKMHFDGRVDKLKEEWNGYLHAMEMAPESAKKLQKDFFPQEVGYDKKEGYVVLALTSKTGTVLGFTKRRVDELHEKGENGKYRSPKWKHSSLNDSLIGQCHNVFNLFNASKAIKKEKKVVVCEGPKDVIAYQRVDIQYVVGVCGTGNSNNIWDVILPVDDIYLSMDGDNVGVGTVLKNVTYLAPSHDVSRIFVVTMPEGMDPYDVVTQLGGKELVKRYESPMSALDFCVLHGGLNEVKELYGSLPEHSKIPLMKSICKVKGFSVKEAESWMFGSEKSAQQQPVNKEKSMLLAVAKGEAEVVNMKPDRAKRILKLKYNIEV